jgi:predicted methyltransferase
MKRSLAAAALALGLFAAPAIAATIPANITAAVADPTRPKDDRDQDALRLPAETLAFSGVKPGMKVGELFPGGGYYTRMLIDVVGPKGAVWGMENTGWKGAVEADDKVVAELKKPNLSVDGEPFGQFKLPGKIDLFWITQNYHDLHIAKYGKVDMAAFNKAVFAALKPGGTYFILDHDAKPGTTDEQISHLHRIPKAELIKEVEAAGFRLKGEGRFLERPGDDLTKTVFDPAIRGHTNQYALKFVRP